MFKKKILVIQTAFIGDAILATSVLEKLHQHFASAKIDFFIRKGNEGLFEGHPFINHLYVWDKKGGKYKNLLSILKKVRNEDYLYVINLQRYLSTGVFTAFSRGGKKFGFENNPFSFSFDKKFPHDMNSGKHEVERNQSLITAITNETPAVPKLYPSAAHFENVQKYKSTPYVCISPASVWFTKQFPENKWIELIKKLDSKYKIYLLGGPVDKQVCENLRRKSVSPRTFNLAGKLNLLESAALMKDAAMNYSNDSAPLHLASAMDAPITSVFCSTIPEFGFGPLSENSKIIEIEEKLDCRPCGLHGKRACPKGHFKCATGIKIEDLLFD